MDLPKVKIKVTTKEKYRKVTRKEVIMNRLVGHNEFSPRYQISFQLANISFSRKIIAMSFRLYTHFYLV